MRYILAIILSVWASSALAQAPTRLCYSSINGDTRNCIPVDAGWPLPVTASVSVGGFAPGLAFATLTASGTSDSVALPTGASVQFQNTGTTAVSCTLGIGSATAIANEIIIQPSSTKVLVVGTNTFGACIDQTGSASNLVVLNGGSGLGTDSGGGGGSSSSASVGATGASVPSSADYVGMNVGGNLTGLTGTANGLKVDPSAVVQPISVASGAIVDGGDATLGAKVDAACSTDTGTCSLIQLVKRTNQNVASPANLAAAATGGCTGQTILSAASNNATVIGSAAAHTLCWIRWEQTTTTLMDIRAYDTATAPSGGAPCNSATGVVTNDVAQSNATSPGGVANLGTFGQAFVNGIVICITGANANNDNNNAVTGLNLNIGYK